ncbi:MAG: prenyltransferase/squalene oxidase repeat-containing protein [Promethearchaeota archaeon]
MFLILFFTLNIIPSVLGKTRRVYLTDYVLSNEIEGQGFKNGQISGNDVSFEATAYALEILSNLGRSAQETTSLQTNLEAEINNMFNGIVNLYDLYYLLKSLFIIDRDYSIDGSLKNRIYQYLNDTEQVGGGFSFLNATISPSLSSTYFVVQIHSLLAPSQTLQNMTLHKDWVLSNSNVDGGYGNTTSTLLSTYYAVALLDYFEEDLANKSKTLSYLTSFYVSNPSDEDNIGGYKPALTSKTSLLSSTYYCVMTISLINNSFLNAGSTRNWVLSRQYFQDGGFSDITEGSDQPSSSVVGSFFAFKTIYAFNPSLDRLDVEIWMVEFNYWILIILMASIGIIVVIGIVIWRRRRI